MRMIKIIIAILSLVVVAEFVVLNKIQSTGGKKSAKQSVSLKPSLASQAKAPSPTIYLNQVQDWVIRDIKGYMQSKDEPKKKMVNVMLYTGWIDSIAFDADKVTITTTNDDGEKIEKYPNWSVESFYVYEKKGDDLIRTNLRDLKAKTKVTIKEYEEVVRDTMDPKHILSYVEIVIQN